ncbi:MAG: hypothetical protein ACLSE7_09720 [Lachnospirales bacterium]
MIRAFFPHHAQKIRAGKDVVADDGDRFALDLFRDDDVFRVSGASVETGDRAVVARYVICGPIFIDVVPLFAVDDIVITDKLAAAGLGIRSIGVGRRTQARQERQAHDDGK